METVAYSVIVYLPKPELAGAHWQKLHSGARVDVMQRRNIGWNRDNQATAGSPNILAK